MRKLFPFLAAVACSLSTALPSTAGSFNDANKLVDLVTASGTTVSFNDNRFDKNCLGNMGYYQYIKDRSDVLIVCKDQTDVNDPDEVWEVLAHESTHTMQACNGGPLFKASYHPRIFRALSSKAPHYAKLIDNQYAGNVAIVEAEAFWMELQSPEIVTKLFTTYCLSDD